MEDERFFVVVHLDELRERLLWLLHIDIGIPRVVEDAEEAVDAYVDARRLQQRDVIRVDPDAPLGDEPFDGDVAEDHRLILPSARRRARGVPSRTPRAPSCRASQAPAPAARCA